MDRNLKDFARFNSSSFSSRSEPILSSNPKQLIEWLNGILPDSRLSVNISDEELREFLVDGSVLCRLLNKLKPGSVTQRGGSSGVENVERFLSAMEEMGLARFQVADLQKGSMKKVLECLSTLMNSGRVRRSMDATSPGWKVVGDRVASSMTSTPKEERFRMLSSPPFGEDRRKLLPESKSPHGFRTPKITNTHAGHKFHEVFQHKQGSYTDLPAAKISEMMKSNSLDNAPTQSLLSVVNGILDEMKNGAIPHRVACLLRKVVQEIERRICTQAEHLRTQNNLFKAREDKYQSRIRVLEALATGTTDDTQMFMNQFKQIKTDKSKPEEKQDDLNQQVIRDTNGSMKEKDEFNKNSRQTGEQRSGAGSIQQELHDRLQEALISLTESKARIKELEENKIEMPKESPTELKAEAETGQQQLENRLKEAFISKTKELEASSCKQDIEDRLEESLSLLKESRARVKELEEMKSEPARGGSQEEELKEAQRLLTECRARIKELEAMKAEAGGNKQEIEGRKKEAVADSRTSVKELEAMKAEARNRQQELEGRLTEALSSITQLRCRVQELEAMKAAAGGTQQELQSRLEEAVSSLTQSKARVKELEAMRTATGGTQQDLQNKLDESISLTTELRSRVRELEAVNTEARSTKQELEANLKEAVSSLAESRSRVKELEPMKSEAETSQQELENRLTEAGNELRSRVKELEVMKSQAGATQQQLENRLKEAQTRVNDLEALSKSKSEQRKKTQNLYHIYTEFQLGALRELQFTSQSIKQEMLKTVKIYLEEFSSLGPKVEILGTAANNYYPLLRENQKLHNELQELKGNIRVYCRIRPFLPGQKGKQTIIEHVGENGELIVANPTKPGKEGRRSFRFDKVYGPTSTQAQVFSDTQPLIQSVLDGYNVCIFAYGQTGSGKTYTMTGPDGASEEEWGVNYRALNDLFKITQSRGSIYQYEVSVQMVEIYNEQVRDLLSSDGKKKLGIMTTSKPNGLAVPDACIQSVNSTSDVVKLMDIGLNNRAKSSTAMNERSSRSHSIVSIHTRGSDMKTGTSLRGSLHLVDLAGSERVDRSEVTGDRLKEAQNINKSLSALGDVIFALAQKNAHVPYRNSKLTQVLQSSLGGHAKTLMFVQLNPDATSYSETLSTLKFAERVSGVELGAAKSNKDSRDVRDLMEQVATLKETIAKKDENIEALKDPKSSGAAGEKRSTSSLRSR